MFECHNCKKQVGPNQPENKMVVARRPKIYENLVIHGRERGTVRLTEGWETVQEAKLCPACFQVLTGQTPIVVLPTPKKPVQKQEEKPRKPRYNDRKNNRPERKKPVVEVINPIQVVK